MAGIPMSLEELARLEAQEDAQRNDARAGAFFSGGPAAGPPAPNMTADPRMAPPAPPPPPPPPPPGQPAPDPAFVAGAIDANPAHDLAPAQAPAPAPMQPPPAPPPPTTIAPVTVSASPADARAAMSGGGGAVNRDPYGQKAALSRILGTYDAQAGAMGAQARAEGARAIDQSDRQAVLAREQQEDAAIARAEGEERDRILQDHMAEAQRQLDAVKEKKIDPLAGMPHGGLGMLAIIGGVVGGLYQGMTRSASNPFLDELHTMMNNSMRAQEKNIDNERAGVEGQMSLLGQMRAIYKDKDLADAQARNLYYEATKQAISAEAARYDAPIVQSRADQAIAAVTREQAGVQKQIADQMAARAAAGASQLVAQRKEAQARIDKIVLDTYNHALDKTGDPARAEYEASRMLVNLTSGEGAGAREPQAAGSVPLSPEAREKLRATQVASDEFNRQIDAAKVHPAVTGAGLGTAAESSFGQRLAPEASKTVQQLASINNQMLQAIGKVAKDADGKPNKVMIDKIEQRFELKASDTPAMRMEKLEGVRSAYNALAREEGANAPEPNKDPGVQLLDANGKPK